MSESERDELHDGLEERIAGRYRVVAQLARGGMGLVYSVYDESTKRRVALKRLLQKRSDHVAKLFEREYHTLAQLRHPRIIEVYEYGVDDRGSYYTMELLDGEDLRDLAPIGYRAACRHLRDIASSLALLHARRLLHRDISPRNVRVTSDGRAKLIDFGALTTFGVNEQVVGTPPGISPEALHGLDLDQRADLYTFGALCYWVLTGRHAYPARDLKLLPPLWRAGPPEPPSQFVPEVPPALDELVLSLLSQDVLGRPSSAAEVIERLNTIGDLEPEEAPEIGTGYLANPRLVGRERELSVMRGFLGRLAQRRSVGVVVSGVPGVGKTRFLAEAGLEAQLRGATVLRVDAEAHRGPYAPVRAICELLLAKLPDVAAAALTPHASWLGHLAPALAASVGLGQLPRLPRDRGEQRAGMQSALIGWFRDVAEHTSVVIIVDNAHAADESSLAVFALLPRQAVESPLAVWISLRVDEKGESPEMIHALQESFAAVDLEALAAPESIALVQALFGDVQHAGRLGRWLHDRTGGNLAQCMSLATQLVELQEVTYQNGAWVLPAELSDSAIPGGLHGLHERQLGRLSMVARTLAESLSVEDGQISVEQCIALAGMTAERAFAALAELVARGMLVSAGENYRFSHKALREYVYSMMAADRRRQIHLRAAAFLMEHHKRDTHAQIYAGWHLMRGGEESRGADVLSNAGRKLVFTIEGLRFAAPGLEAALEVYDREKRSPWVILPVLDALIAAAWYVDRKYAERYGERTLTLALELTGLTLAEKFAKVMGRDRGLKAGLGAAVLRHRLQQKQIRSRALMKFKGVFGPLVNSMSCLVGTAAASLDGATARRVLDKVVMMSAFEKGDVVSVMYDYARFYTLVAEGRFVDAEPIGFEILEWFRSAKAQKFLGPEGQRALCGGIMTGLAQVASMRDDGAALAWADQLGELDFSLYKLMGSQGRFMYHAQKGELSKARPHREQLELNAIQGGTTWQSSIMLPFTLANVYAKTGDVAGLRQMTEVLERRATDVQALMPIAELFRAEYELVRGHKKEALGRLESCMRQLGPHSCIPWPFAMSTHARAMLATGRLPEARAIIERARAHVKEADLSYPFMFLDVDITRSLIDAADNRLDEAIQRIDGLIDRLSSERGPLTMCRLHEVRAQLALQADDMQGFSDHVGHLEQWARRTENPSLVARFKRLEGEGRRLLGLSSSSVAPRSARMDSFASAARSLLEAKDGVERAETALRIAVERSRARGGYLYLGEPPHLELIAREPANDVPPEALLDHVVALARNISRGSEYTFGSGENATATAGGTKLTAIAEAADLHVDLLIIPHGGGTMVVGALVLRRPPSGLQPLTYDLLEAIARSLHGMKEYHTGTFVGDGELSKLFGDA